MRRRRAASIQADIWPGFTDAISSMILVLIFIITTYAVMEAGLSRILGGKELAIVRLENQLEELKEYLGRTIERAKELEAKVERLSARFALAEKEKEGALEEAELAAETIAVSKRKIDELSNQLEEYLTQLRDLSERLKLAEREKREEKLRGDQLSESLEELMAKMDELKKRIGDTEEQLVEKGLTISDLLIRLEKKEREVEELRKLEKYKSDFLANLKDIFEGHPNIRIVGDRFIFQAEVLFASGSDSINEDGKKELDKFVDAFLKIRDKVPSGLNLNIQVQGHTDTDPVVYSDRFESNWELSSSRALQVVKYFISRGISPSLLSAAGYSEYYPRVPGKSWEAKRYNRRIEIKLTTP